MACGGLFPLTPALSLGALGERVNRSLRGEQSRLLGFPPRHLMSGFPLPEGEGQGDGNGANDLLAYQTIPGTVELDQSSGKAGGFLKCL